MERCRAMRVCKVFFRLGNEDTECPGKQGLNSEGLFTISGSFDNLLGSEANCQYLFITGNFKRVERVVT